MKQEKLKAGYSFIALWRTVAHVAMIAGCIASLVFMGIGLVVGIIAFNSMAPARKAAEVQHEKTEDGCRASIKKERDDYEKYADELPQRLEQIKREHEQTLKQYQIDVAEYSKAVQSLVTEYNNTTAVTEGELKRLRNLNGKEIKSLSLPLSDLTSASDHSEYSKTVDACSATLAKYREMIEGSVMDSYDEYVAPLYSRLSELEKNISDLKNRIASEERYYDNQIAALERSRRSVPTERYEGRPEKNIYGTTDVSALSKIFGASDALTIYSARLLCQAPLTEGGRSGLRQKTLGLSDWLPVYTRTYAPSQEEKNAIFAHNAKVDDDVRKLNRDKAEKIRTMQNELVVLQDEHAQCSALKNSVVKEKEHLAKFTRETTQGWTSTKSIAAVQEKLQQGFPVAPDKLEVKLQKEQDMVPERERAMLAKVQALEETIDNSETVLKAALAPLKFAERQACAVALIPNMGIAMGILVGTWVAFWLLLVMGDFMVCPLVVASKTQEIAVNTRKEETV